MRLVLPVLLVSACGFPRASTEFTCTVTSDCDGGRVCEQGFCVVGEEPDAPTPTDAALFTCTDWTPAPRHFEPCEIPLPKNDPLALEMTGEYIYDTSSGTLTDPANGTSTPTNMMIASGRLISVSSLSIAANVTLRVVGDPPLIVASWTTIDIAATGTLDAGGKGIAGGAGTVNSASDCAMHAPTRGGNSGAGAAGSGGGGFRGVGGAGGDGGGNNNNGAGGGAVPQPLLLLAGCPGAEGGIGDTPGGLPGGGGGAVQLTARVSITIAGNVNAGGGGGGGSLGIGTGDGGGGGGGGSGGMIGIEAPTLTVAGGAFLTANGGGGGCGGGDQNGAPGSDGTPIAGRPPGGAGDGGDGGPGSGGGVAAGNFNGLQGNETSTHGGGGGGGAAGYISILSPAATIATLAIITPPNSPPLP